MAEISEECKFKIQRNLADAGCDAPLIAQFLALEQKRQRAAQYRLLFCHRTVLLEQLHQEQYKIDCLDHMIYIMQTEDRRTNGGE